MLNKKHSSFCRCFNRLLLVLRSLILKHTLLKGTFILSLLFALIYCGDSGTSPDQREYVLPDENLSYYDDLQPMFNGKCGFGSECHAPDNSELYINFTDRDAFINYTVSVTGLPLVRPLVDREAPELSVLYQIVTENYSGIERMPPLSMGREPLTQNQINGIKQWIAEGAKP